MNMPLFKARFHKAYAAGVLRLHQAKIKFVFWRLRHGLKLVILTLLAAVVASVLSVPFLRRLVGGYFNSQESLGALRTLLGGTGSALIGAAAIAFSIIVFAMQTNVERMPHGLFKQLSSDRRLLSSFLGSFLTAIAIAGTSLIPDGNWAIPAILVALWGIAGILLLFLYAYRRALQLINPIGQLNIMSTVVRRDLRKWSRLADNAAILLREAQAPMFPEANAEFQFNVPKAKFYQFNAHWSTSTRQAIDYSISYAKRFAGQGDHEVTDSAFHHLMLINAAYCAAKHGTFVGSNPFFDMPEVSDNTINTSLEQLRQTMQDALSKGDERLAESTLRAFGGLYGVYLGIEYPGREGSKHHAMLASTYLASAVESVIPHNMPDLMMHGIRMMGRASLMALEHTNSNVIVTLAEKIGVFAFVGMVKANHQPVTLTAFDQLTELTLNLLAKGKHDIGYPVGQLRSAVTTAAKGVLGTADTALVSTHCSTLGPYFSSASETSLRGRLTSLVNELLEASADHGRASEIIANIETWAHQIYAPHKELLLLAVEKRSPFTLDAINWAIGISELLNALSNAPACPEHLEDDLKRHAVWLISTLSFLPDDRESVAFVESHSLTDSLFEAALDGSRRGYIDFFNDCKKLLLGWGKKGGKHETGWAILDSSVKALVALAIAEGTEEAVVTLKAQFGEMLASKGAPSAEMCQRTAERLTAGARQIRNIHPFRSIDRVLGQQDNARVRGLLLEMAQMLAGEPLEEAHQNP